MHCKHLWGPLGPCVVCGYSPWAEALAAPIYRNAPETELVLEGLMEKLEPESDKCVTPVTKSC